MGRTWCRRIHDHGTASAVSGDTAETRLRAAPMSRSYGASIQSSAAANTVPAPQRDPLPLPDAPSSTISSRWRNEDRPAQRLHLHLPHPAGQGGRGMSDALLPGSEDGELTMPRKSLLVCGILASLVYVAADVLAAIRYPEYHSFTSRAISELMANGAPTERLGTTERIDIGAF